MIRVEKIESETGVFDISLIDKDNVLKLLFGGNGDLYWGLYLPNCTRFGQRPDKTKFHITKENMDIYQLFDTLYNDIKECKIHDTFDCDLLDCETDEEIIKKHKENEQYNNDLKKSYAYNLLFKNNIISWHSDDYCYDDGNVVNIIKDEEQYVIDFEFKEKNSIYSSSWVRFRNSGSTFDPFNQLFMRMFNNFQDYDTEYHQMYIEEYIYQKSKKNKLTKKIGVL